MTQSGPSPKLGYASGTFGVRYRETLDYEAVVILQHAAMM
jgi:hypothetical protein